VLRDRVIFYTKKPKKPDCQKLYKNPVFSLFETSFFDYLMIKLNERGNNEVLLRFEL